ncbi:iron(III) transport system permease protein [Clostridium grantii DSM 8605]|uniref:Iron(III) transport system permease protein n=2 Tax=Clostridium TaxID=1485 RepID=A0A1M5X0N3_9CLOT|nr:iron ABC transporter permease [Clostridium grantii]SHH93290.1 iron(III) transport system permease protein [Clostridium grantii DSM 8605]
MGKIRGLKKPINIWGILSFIFILLIVIPNVNIFIKLFQAPNENWTHIKEYLLKDFVINSTVLIFFTGLFTIILGTSLAWMISVYQFPFRNFLKWALVLPLAIPAYIGAYTYHGILKYTGVFQSFLRNSFNISVNQKYFNIMSMEGAIFVFTIFLFPYVYLITKSFLEKQSSALIENAIVLGRSYTEIFFMIVLPISRVSIVGGVSLVILEVLNDYGVVKYFGVQTFSTAIFKTWFSMGDLESSIRLSAILMMMVVSILVFEHFLRGRRKYSFTTTKIRPLKLIELKGIKKVLASIYGVTIFSFGFLIPLIQLLYWASITYKTILSYKFIILLGNSLLVAAYSSVIIIIVALIISNYCRINNSFISKIYSRITMIGYSIPGAVISIGVIVFFVSLDNKLFWLYKIINPNTGKLVLSTSIIMLIFAYIVRFLAIGYNPIEAGYEKVGLKFFEASRMLGMGITETFLKVDFKMIKSAVISAFLLVFVDVLKELPLTLILRPFNFNTLATKSFEYANDEMVQEAAISSLIIIIISTILIYFFYKLGDREEKNVG